MSAGPAGTADTLWGALERRSCPVCGSADDSHERFAERRASLDRRTAFAARKEPEPVSLRLVVCPTCALLYAPAAPPAAFLARAYGEAAFEGEEEARCASESYTAAIRARLDRLPRPLRALDIGCGNGALLAALVALGFEEVVGFEPSAAAAAAAAPELRRRIRVAPFDPRSVGAELPRGSFALVVANQTLEHVEAPLALLKAAHELLAPGGAFMSVAHDYRHWLMRLLGRGSPIIDIEHLQVFSRASLARALKAAGFERLEIEPFANRYPLRYWVRLAPLPRAVKRPLQRWLTGAGARLGGLSLTARVGNLIAWAHRPGRSPG